jgi:predicted nucleic acid-binding protein
VIAADTSTWIAYLQGEAGPDAEILDEALAKRSVLMPPAVLTELLSDPKLPAHVAATLGAVPLLGISEGFWVRASAIRGLAPARRRKARLGDALIAQSCIDHGVPLLTRDRDFRTFARAANLDLVIP